jgi:sugar-phosphatase
MAPSPIRCGAVLLDMDGVLVDSAEEIEFAWREWAALHQIDPEDIFRCSHGQRTVDTLKIVVPHLDCEAEALLLESQEIERSATARACAGAATLFKQIPKERVAVVTSASRALARARLIGAGFSLPMILVSGEDVSSGKPDPEGYLRAADRLAVPADSALVIEDAPAGIAAARTAGMRVIAVATTHAEHELVDADFVVSTLDAVSALASDGYVNITVAAQ